MPSGIFLPNVLESTKDNLVTQTELVRFGALIGSHFQWNTTLGVDVLGNVGYISPQRVEHAYDIGTLGSFDWGINIMARYRFRDTAS